MVTLTPRDYTWDFGDGRKGSRRTFSAADGLGRPYTDAQHESPVKWSYEFDSRGLPNGFPVTLTIRFGGVFTANGSAPQALGDREVTWNAGLVMRQAQTFNVAPERRREAGR